jgi:hypothetical protein
MEGRRGGGWRRRGITTRKRRRDAEDRRMTIRANSEGSSSASRINFF